MVNQTGALMETIVVKKEKRFPWLKPPTLAIQRLRSPLWYVEETYYNTKTKCSSGQVVKPVQMAHRYIDSEGSLWELGGQPNTACGDQTFNVYSDIENKGAPIIMAPTLTAERKTFLSEFWIAKQPFSFSPQGYPNIHPNTLNQNNYAFSWASSVQRLNSLTINVAGKSKEYYDVLVVKWIHGSKYTERQREKFGNYPCKEYIENENSLNINPIIHSHKILLDSGWNTYSILKYYAKDKPGISQVGGLIQSELQWYCQFDGTNYKAFGSTLGQSTTHFRRFY